jgi:dipeptidyl aminopeptidase/acylaminoacyl peptidase
MGGEPVLSNRIMKSTKVPPFGFWPSPITPGNTASHLSISEPAWNHEGKLLWRERDSSRASIRISAGETGSPGILSGSYQVGGSLLYGGGSFDCGREGLVFVDRISGQLISADQNGESFQALTQNLHQAASPKISADGKWALIIDSEGENDGLYLIDLENRQEPGQIDGSADFYNYPRWHPQGTLLAWMSWNHPHMPWTSSEIWLGKLEISPQGSPQLVDRERIAGGEEISVLQPEFSPDGRFLAYISDQSGWWQLYLYDLTSQNHAQLTHTPAEHALPAWLQDRGSYGFSPDSQHITFLRNQEGVRSLWTWDLKQGTEEQIILDESYTWLDWLAASPTRDEIAIIASASHLPPRLIRADRDGNTSIIRETSKVSLSRKVFSKPRSISWQNSSKVIVRGLFYPPHNPGFHSSGKPPLIVIIHSGPTRQKAADFQPRTQYFTSRGFAVLEVNYRGSSGYGRSYRQSLAGEWGVADVEDCLSGALFTAEQGWTDRENMFLLGSSSGGLTVFQTLVRHPGVFRAGITLYAVVNHLDLLNDPLKFERYYSDWLIGPYPETKDLYRDRSPVFLADKIQDPVLVFQGGQDSVVPQDQAEQIIKALDANGVPFEYYIYPEEGHGFKQAETIADFYNKTEQFIRQFLSDR